MPKGKRPEGNEMEALIYPYLRQRSPESRKKDNDEALVRIHHEGLLLCSVL